MKNCLMNKQNVSKLIHEKNKRISSEALECMNNKMRTLIYKACNNANGKKTIILEDVAIIELKNVV